MSGGGNSGPGSIGGGGGGPGTRARRRRAPSSGGLGSARRRRRHSRRRAARLESSELGREPAQRWVRVWQGAERPRRRRGERRGRGGGRPLSAAIPSPGPTDGSGRGFSGGGDAAAGAAKSQFSNGVAPCGGFVYRDTTRTAATRRCRGSTEPCPGLWVTCPCTKTGRRRWRARLSRTAGTTARRTGRKGCPRRSCPRMAAARRVPRTSTCDADANV